MCCFMILLRDDLGFVCCLGGVSVLCFRWCVEFAVVDICLRLTVCFIVLMSCVV